MKRIGALFMSSVVLGACAMPQPRPTSLDIIEDAQSEVVAKRLFKLAEQCWYSTDGAVLVGRQVNGTKLSPTHSQITVNFRYNSQNRPPAPFFTVDIVERNGKTVVSSKKSKCLAGCDVPLEEDLKRWVAGDLTCSNLGAL